MSEHNKKILYFAYGSNMDPERMTTRMKEFGTKFFSRKPAILRGYKLFFNKEADKPPGAGYANIVKDGLGVVEGVLYEITEKGLEALDYYEGCNTGNYKRERLKVECANKDCIAEVYIANEAKVKSGLKPTREYMAHLLKGRDLLSKEYVEMLERVKTYD